VQTQTVSGSLVKIQGLMRTENFRIHTSLVMFR